jgi:hypothetical protein
VWQGGVLHSCQYLQKVSYAVDAMVSRWPRKGSRGAAEFLMIVEIEGSFDDEFGARSAPTKPHVQ